MTQSVQTDIRMPNKPAPPNAGIASQLTSNIIGPASVSRSVRLLKIDASNPFRMPRANAPVGAK